MEHNVYFATKTQSLKGAQRSIFKHAMYLQFLSVIEPLWCIKDF
jgi:hypothetical protein